MSDEGVTTRGWSATHWGAFEAEVTDGRLTAIHPFYKDVAAPPILSGMIESTHAANRVRRPSVREGYLRNGPTRGVMRGSEPFVEIPWDEALDLVAERLASVRDVHGNEAIFGGSYGWSSAGRVNHARTLTHRFLNHFGGHTGQVQNYSWGAGEIILNHVLGDREAVSGYVTDWTNICDHTDLMVLFGGAPDKNFQVTSGGAGRHESASWFVRAREAGTKFVVISPLKSDAPEALGAEWISIRPGTDTAMMLAMAQVLLAEGLADRGFIDRYTTGFDAFAAYLDGTEDGVVKSPEWAAPITGVPAEVIRDLAHRLVASRSLMSATWSLQRADHGEQPYWALIALAAAVGQIGLPGGGVAFGYGSINGYGTPRRSVRVPYMPSGQNPLAAGAIPCARIGDLLTRPGESVAFDGREITYPDIRVIYWAGGNPFHHHQDLNRLRRGWANVETVIVHEPWWTPLAKQADIVLPATTPIERPDFAASSRDNFILAMHPVLPPQHEARDDYVIFADLAKRLGFEDAFTEGRDIMGWTRHLYEQARVGSDLIPPFEDFWAEGHVEFPAPDAPAVMLQAFRVDPKAHPLPTPSGRIEVSSDTIGSFGYDDCPSHPVWIAPKEYLGRAAPDELHLLTNQPATKLHSQLDGVGVSKSAKRDGREVVTLNTEDAAARALAPGDTVRIYNARGACLAVVATDADMRPGVACLPTGSWYDPTDFSHATPLEKSGNPNVLTRDEGTSKLAQGCAAQSLLVRIEKATGPVPPVTAHDLPAFVERD
ncbi:MAG: molybdopterin-dependent oxidoreductase [Pseudomonadota bacterium]|nr:molybdopterin-dependent oxidoreductase [Pseudomonadota bacterium]